MYLSLEHHVSSGSDGSRHLSISSPAELARLHCLLRDFTSLLQVVGRVSSLFAGDEFLARITEASELVRQLIFLASYGAKEKFYSLQGLSAEIAKDFVDV